MLIKLCELPSSQYRFNLFRANWTTNSKEVFLPQRLGELSYAHFYPFSESGEYIQKGDHTGVFFLFLESLNIKTPSSIYFIGIAKIHVIMS